MRLEMENGDSFENPSAETIESVVGRLGTPGRAFAILCRGEQFYVQAGADSSRRCDLEYREGTEASHRRCTSDTLTVQQIVAVFQDYARPSDAWRSWFQWTPLFG